MSQSSPMSIFLSIASISPVVNRPPESLEKNSRVSFRRMSCSLTAKYRDVTEISWHRSLLLHSLGYLAMYRSK